MVGARHFCVSDLAGKSLKWTFGGQDRGTGTGWEGQTPPPPPPQLHLPPASLQLQPNLPPPKPSLLISLHAISVVSTGRLKLCSHVCSPDHFTHTPKTNTHTHWRVTLEVECFEGKGILRYKLAHIGVPEGESRTGIAGMYVIAYNNNNNNNN